MKLGKLGAGLAIAAVMAAPASAAAAPPPHAKAWGKRCQGFSKVKDPLTRVSPFKQCQKAKGVGYVLGPDGMYMLPVVVPPTDPTGTAAS